MMQTPSANFQPLLDKQNSVKERLSTVANVLEARGDLASASKLRSIRDSLNLYNKALLSVFDPDDPCSAFSFIEQTSALFGFDPEGYDYYSDTKATVENIWKITNDVPLKILTEVDDILAQIEQTSENVNDQITRIENGIEDANTEMDDLSGDISDVKNKILKDHKKMLFVLAAMSMPIEDVQLFLDKAKLFEQTVLIPCSGYWKAKFLEGFRDEYGLIDVENILSQTEKVREIMNSIPDNVL